MHEGTNSCSLLPPTITTFYYRHLAQICVADVEAQEPVEGIRSIPRDRWELSCCVCRQRMGAKIQCAFASCFTAYHPLCARVAGALSRGCLCGGWQMHRGGAGLWVQATGKGLVVSLFVLTAHPQFTACPPTLVPTPPSTRTNPTNPTAPHRAAGGPESSTHPLTHPPMQGSTWSCGMGLRDPRDPSSTSPTARATPSRSRTCRVRLPAPLPEGEGAAGAMAR